jgi:hypothetical protein
VLNNVHKKKKNTPIKEKREGIAGVFKDPESNDS